MQYTEHFPGSSWQLWAFLAEKDSLKSKGHGYCRPHEGLFRSPTMSQADDWISVLPCYQWTGIQFRGLPN